MIPANEKSLGQALVAAHLMTPEELEKAIESVEKKKSPSLIIRLIENDFLKFNMFQKFLSQNYKIKTAILNAQEIPHTLVNKIGLELMKERMIIPIMAKVVSGSPKLALGMVNPLDEKTISEVQTRTKHDVTPILISLPDFKETCGSLDGFQKKSERTATASFEEQIKTGAEKPTSDVGFIGSNINKYREEIALKLVLDEKDYAALKKDSYSRVELMEALKTVKKSVLEKNFDGLKSEFKVEALINALIHKGLLTKQDVLISGAASKVFGEESN